MPEARSGHVILGVNVLLLGYLPAAWQWDPRLWQSWPYESIIADRQTRIYARGEQIVHIGHRGVFDIDGPLTVPTTPQGSPVLAWYARTAEEAEAAQGVADVLIRPVGQEHGPGAAAAGGPGRPLLFLEVTAGGGHLSSRLRTHRRPGSRGDPASSLGPARPPRTRHRHRAGARRRRRDPRGHRVGDPA